MILLLWFWDSDGLLSMTATRRKLFEQLTPKSQGSDGDPLFGDEDDGIVRTTGDN